MKRPLRVLLIDTNDAHGGVPRVHQNPDARLLKEQEIRVVGAVPVPP